jgi:ABC-type Fe3+ transport system permease subunit
MAEQQLSEPLDRRLSRWGRNLLVALVVCVLLALVGLLGASFLPRWWAHRIGDQVGGSISAGITLGLFYGFVFVALPLLVLRIAFRRRRPWRWWLVGVLVALLLATPNLLTLGIVLGRGNAAHAGDRTLDVEAPAFRTSVLIGAIVAVAAAVGVEYLVASRRRAHRETRRLQDRLDEHERAAAEAEPRPPAADDPE